MPTATAAGLLLFYVGCYLRLDITTHKGPWTPQAAALHCAEQDRMRTSVRRSAAADSHMLQTGASCVCRSTACADWSLSLCVSLCSVLTHPYVYVAGNMSARSRAQAAVFGVMRRRVPWLRGSVRQQHVCVSASDAPCSPLPISPSHLSRLVR